MLHTWLNSKSAPTFFVVVSGVPRETEKEKELADFDIFDDPETPYSTFNFQYSNEAFIQLHDLMEFNTLNNLEVSSALLQNWCTTVLPVERVTVDVFIKIK